MMPSPPDRTALEIYLTISCSESQAAGERGGKRLSLRAPSFLGGGRAHTWVSLPALMMCEVKWPA